ncbi:TPA: heavy metal transporter [Escherichia coli]|uniref:single-stranded DNA-binding protein n=1 Tax=Escherichia coli TaxID=562 RepID=UPI000B50361E|nr:heavy metal transporter [Escherichia coli]EKW8735709.1 heavy metal transporter [Escherichia coli]MBE1071860.1 heavy metal transporter [Escherichia coli]TFL57571.1 heavy metal transporter [Escherichia coli]TFL57579.1 heavy metal transporter [Escherichia coli]HAJ5014095.1 heavy metal transporter [Escherichia coli]
MAKITLDTRDLLIVVVEEGDDVIEVNTFSYQEKDKTGEPVFNDDGSKKMVERESRIQKMLLERGRERIEIVVPVNEGQPPYSVGRYLIHPSYFKVNERGVINTARPWDLVFIPLDSKDGKEKL